MNRTNTVTTLTPVYRPAREPQRKLATATAADSRFASDPAMTLLLSIATGNGLIVHRGQLVMPDVTRPDHGLLIHDDDFTALETREWIVIGETNVQATDRGIYWLQRWVDANWRVFGKGVKVAELRVLADERSRVVGV